MNTTMATQQPNIAMQAGTKADAAPRAAGGRAVEQGVKDANGAKGSKDNEFLTELLSQMLGIGTGEDIANEAAEKTAAENGGLLAAQMLVQNPMAAQMLVQNPMAAQMPAQNPMAVQMAAQNPMAIQNSTAAQNPMVAQAGEAGQLIAANEANNTADMLVQQLISAQGTAQQPQGEGFAKELENINSAPQANAQELMQSTAQANVNNAMALQQGAVPETLRMAEQFDALIAQLSGSVKQNTVQSDVKTKGDGAASGKGYVPQMDATAKLPKDLGVTVLSSEGADAEALAKGKGALETDAAKLRTANITPEAAQKPKEETAQPNKAEAKKAALQVDEAALEAAQRFTRTQGTPQPIMKAASIADKQDLLRQVTTGAMENAKAGKEDFVMKLSPEGMGEITVKMAEASGKITMQITASNANVQKMLSAELENLREAMKPYHVEVREIMQQQTNHFDLGSQNPNANQQHFTNQFAYQQNGQSRHQNLPYYYDGIHMQQGDTEAEDIVQIKPSSAMDIYA